MNSENNGEITCPSCGFRSRAGAKFCGGCGEPLQADATCSACGMVNEAAHRFCVNCGIRLEGAAAAVVDANRAAGIPAAEERVNPSLPFSMQLQNLSFRGKAISLLAVLAALAIVAVLLLRDGTGTDESAHSPASGDSPSVAHLLPSGDTEIRLEPDPSTLDIRSDPTVHHSIVMVSDHSGLVKAEYPDETVIVVHNDAGLLERDACAEVKLAPEGTYTLLLIKPGDISGEWRPMFYLVGCAPGETLLTLESEHGIITYIVEVTAP